MNSKACGLGLIISGVALLAGMLVSDRRYEKEMKKAHEALTEQNQLLRNIITLQQINAALEEEEAVK